MREEKGGVAMELFENLKNVWVMPLGGDGFAWASWIWIANSIFWLLDLYPLVKKKSRQETIAVMFLPGFIVVAVAVLSALMLGITTGVPLMGGLSFMRERVCMELLVLAVLFLATWFLAMRLRGSRNDTWKKRLIWALSYVPDLFVVGCILTVSLARLIGGQYLLSDLRGLSEALGFTSYNVFAWLYVYGIITLLIRQALLLVAIFARLASMRISLGSYPENGHPKRRFLWYAIVCQNACVRGMLAFFVPAIMGFVALVFTEGMASVKDVVTLVWVVTFFASVGFAAVLIELKPVAANLRRFRRWGDADALLEQFCREYFNEKPVFQTEDYTVTRHFLVDERSLVSVYYLEMLKGWKCCQIVSLTDYEMKNKTYWIQPHVVEPARRSGWQWEISFLGRDVCCLEKEDASAEELIKSLSRYWDSHQLGADSATRPVIRQNDGQDDGFDKLFQFAAGLVCFSLFVFCLICSIFMS